MAKAGLNAMTLAFAEAWTPNVRVNVVIPGPFDTDIMKAWTPESIAEAKETNPLGRVGVPEDMVGVCLFLASDAAGYVNGAQILVDGGAFRSL
jgi:NAD(P)-dependent dehydrogenase (short-subunit alcohol dehydrogenase family)